MLKLADIVRITGAKPRTVQLWADAKVIVAAPDTDREGSGRHRLFDEREVMVARLIAPLSGWKLSIGALVAIAAEMRRVLPCSESAISRGGFLAIRAAADPNADRYRAEIVNARDWRPPDLRLGQEEIAIFVPLSVLNPHRSG